MWDEIQTTLSAWVRDWKTTGTFLFSKASNGYVDLGATYQSYEFAGNKVTFMIDRSLDIEFSDRKFGMFLDLTPDKQSGTAAINSFTYKNGEMVQNYIPGVGGLDGLTSGPVSSRVAATKKTIFGYSGIAVMNPYKAVILISDKIQNNLF